MTGPITSKKVAALPLEKISTPAKLKEMPTQPNLSLRLRRKVFLSSLSPLRTTLILKNKPSTITVKAPLARPF